MSLTRASWTKYKNWMNEWMNGRFIYRRCRRLIISDVLPCPAVELILVRSAPWNSPSSLDISRCWRQLCGILRSTNRSPYPCRHSTAALFDRRRCSSDDSCHQIVSLTSCLRVAGIGSHVGAAPHRARARSVSHSAKAIHRSGGYFRSVNDTKSITPTVLVSTSIRRD